MLPPMTLAMAVSSRPASSKAWVRLARFDVSKAVVTDGIPTSTIMTTKQHQGHLQSQDDEFAEPEIIDFTYVNVCETDADEVDIVIEGTDPTFRQENQRGDVLTILLSGMQHHSNDALVVSGKAYRIKMLCLRSED